MKNYNIIAFAGRARSGKSYMAQLMQDKYNSKIVVIANMLKGLCSKLLNISINELNVLKNNNKKIDFVFNEDNIQLLSKETDINYLLIAHEVDGKKIETVREMLQYIGTDIIRKYNPSWHIQKMTKEIQYHLNNNNSVVIDDVRFPDEKKAIEDMGGKSYFVTRPLIDNISNHISENSLSINDFDEKSIIFNYGDIKILSDYIQNIVENKNNTVPYYCKYTNSNECVYQYIGQAEKSIVKIKEQYCLLLKNVDNDFIMQNLCDKQYFIFDNDLYITDPYIIEQIKKYIR